jgi:ubiquinone/menaquinone biosynthesis C-methylase UbiE
MLKGIVYTPLAKEVAKHLPDTKEKATIVDLGCGPGVLSIELCKLLPKARIVGIDPSKEMLEMARENSCEAGIRNFEAKVGSAEEIPLEAESADLVVTQSSFHEWEDPKTALSEIFRILKPGGKLMIKDYNRAWISGWKKALFSLIHPLEMFRYTLEDALKMVKESKFTRAEGRAGGMTFLIQAQNTKASDKLGKGQEGTIQPKVLGKTTGASLTEKILMDEIVRVPVLLIQSPKAI